MSWIEEPGVLQSMESQKSWTWLCDQITTNISFKMICIPQYICSDSLRHQWNLYGRKKWYVNICVTYRELRKWENLGNDWDPYMGRCHSKGKELSYNMKVKVTPSCPTLYGPMDYTVYETLQTRILKSIAFPFSRGSSRPRNWIRVSCIKGGSFTNWVVREVQMNGDRNWKPKDLSSLEINRNFMTIIGSSIGYGTSVED